MKLTVAFRNYAKGPKKFYALYEEIFGFDEMLKLIFRPLGSHAVASRRLFMWWCGRIAVCVLGQRTETYSACLVAMCRGVCGGLRTIKKSCIIMTENFELNFISIYIIIRLPKILSTTLQRRQS